MADPQAQALQTRRQLADASSRLAPLLDNQWRNYLALPAEVYAAGGPVNVQSLGQSLGRFEAVARDPRYQALSGRPEFSTTHELLRRYFSLETSRARGRWRCRPRHRDRQSRIDASRWATVALSPQGWQCNCHPNINFVNA